MKYPLYHNNLCPKIWDDKTLKPEVQKALLKISQDFVKNLNEDNDIKLEVNDIVMIGSLTNYNWTNYSDIDLHIVTDYKKLDIDAETAQTMFDAIKGVWNNKHNIVIKGHDVELYIQDIDHETHSPSEYSILNNKWNREPIKEKPSFNKDLIKNKYNEYKKEINKLVEKHDETSLKNLLDKLYKFRQAGLDDGGELSEENIVFKILRALGYLDKIKDSISRIYDKKMSVKESLLEEGVEDIAKSVYEYSVNHHSPVERQGNTLFMYGAPTQKQMMYLKGKSGSFTFGSKNMRVNFKQNGDKIEFSWQF